MDDAQATLTDWFFPSAPSCLREVRLEIVRRHESSRRPTNAGNHGEVFTRSLRMVETMVCEFSTTTCVFIAISVCEQALSVVIHGKPTHIEDKEDTLRSDSRWRVTLCLTSRGITEKVHFVWRTGDLLLDIQHVLRPSNCRQRTVRANDCQLWQLTLQTASWPHHTESLNSSKRFPFILGQRAVQTLAQVTEST